MNILVKGREGKYIRNIIWVFLGNVLPLLVGVFFIPKLISSMGLELFGMLTIIWMLVGYLSLFDFGLGRALTYFIANAASETAGHRSDRIPDMPELCASGLMVACVLGVGAGAVLFFSSRLIVSDVFSITPRLQAIATSGLQWAALATVFTVVASVLRGVLEGYSAFRDVTIGRICVGIWMFIGPWMAYRFFQDFSMSIITIALARIAIVIYYLIVIRRYIILRIMCVERRSVVILLRFGGWMTVSNIVSPVMVYFDRLFIAATFGMTSVAFYATPFEVISKVLLIPSTIGTVAFPRMAEAYSRNDVVEVSKVSRGSTLINLVVLLPVVIIVILGGKTFITWWVSPAFALEAAPIASVLILGVLINALASIPFNKLQASGRSDLTAKIHIFEVPLYLLMLYIYTSFPIIGLSGYAWIWTARVALDWALLQYMIYKGCAS